MNGTHCPTCSCHAGAGRVDDRAPFYRLVLDVERAWLELMAEDRAAGRRKWRPFHTRTAA